MASAADEFRTRPAWLDLFRAFRVAADPVKVWHGFLGVIFAVFTAFVALALLLEVGQLAGGRTSAETLREVRQGNCLAALRTLGAGIAETREDFVRDLRRVRDALGSGELMAAVQRARTARKVLLWMPVFLLLLRLPWAYYGGAISRAAAVEYATGERLSAAEARDFASRWYSAYLWPPVALAIAVVGLVLVAVLLGLAAAHWLAALVLVGGAFGSMWTAVAVKQRANSALLGGVTALVGLAIAVLVCWLLWGVRVPWAAKVGAVVVFPIQVLLALAAVLLRLVLVFGRGVMMSTISFEASETFEAVSRATDYVFRRPWRLGFYTVVGIAYGGLCAAAVLAVALAAFFVALLAAWAGFGGGFRDLYSLLFALGPDAAFWPRVPSFLLWAVICVLGGLVLGWAVAFHQSLRAIAYALLRKSVDLSDTSEVYVDLDRAPRPAGAARGSASAGTAEAPAPAAP